MIDIDKRIERKLFRYYADSLGEPSQEEINEFKQLIREVLEEVTPKRIVPVEIPHGSPYISGRNEAITDMESNIKELGL